MSKSVAGRLKTGEQATEQLQKVMDVERIRIALAGAGDVVYDYIAATGEMIWDEDAAGAFQVYDMNPCQTRDEFLDLLDEEGRANLLHEQDQAGLTGEAAVCEYRIKTGVGTHAWIEDRSAVIVDDKGKVVRTVGLIRFVTQRKERENRLLHLATYDDLTGHLNRSRLRSHLATVLEKLWTEQRSGGFLIAGIDNLGSLNQNFGFDVADEVIIEVGNRLQEILGPEDVLGRVSGNKLGIIIGNCSSDALIGRVNTLRNAARNNVIYTKAGPVSVTTSMGVVSLPYGCKNAKDAFARAEEALGNAKMHGREKVYFYEPSEKTESARRQKLTIADQIMRALGDGRVSLHYQPIISTKTGEPALYECLIRITDTSGQIIPAGHFIPVAEELGLIRTLDRLVVEIALETLRTQPDVHLAINVSGVTATDPTWFEEVIDLIGDHRDLASRLTVEITETVALQEISELSNFLASLRSLGCRIAIDDFGAGYTSYRNLQSLDVDVVKIDGSFVKGIVYSEDSQFFVKALIDLAQKFNLETVAEWVETQEEVDFLKGLGVDYLQGFHLGKPAPKAIWPPQEKGNSSAQVADK